MKKLTITIEDKQKSYDIIIGNNILSELQNIIDISAYTKIAVITDENIWQNWQQVIENALPSQTLHIILPPGEKAKTIDTIQIIWKKLLAPKFDRKSLIINFGGGVIGDMGGFAAATYMRGIDFINIPTTTLAQVDESVGGKTGIDFANIKNLIGTFNQPAKVIIDVATLNTLPKREFISGFAEIIKHGIIKDKAYFDFVTSKDPLSFTQIELVEIIEKSCEIKAEIVEKDEKEKNLRKLVNFGHTIGHAIEALSFETERPLLHGEAISIGMIAEAKIANKIGLLDKKDLEIIIKKLHDAGLPTEIPDFSIEKIIKKMQTDKKNVGGEINFTLIKQIGDGIINQIINEEIIKKSLAEK